MIVVAGRDEMATASGRRRTAGRGGRRTRGSRAAGCFGPSAGAGAGVDRGRLEPRYAGLRRGLRRRSSRLAPASVHGLAFRGLDRPTPPVRAGRFGLRARALESRLRERSSARTGRLARGGLRGRSHSHTIDRSAPALADPHPGTLPPRARLFAIGPLEEGERATACPGGAGRPQAGRQSLGVRGTRQSRGTTRTGRWKSACAATRLTVARPRWRSRACSRYLAQGARTSWRSLESHLP